MSIPVRTIRDIKTRSRVDGRSTPYMAYMQITCLEMEKARKGRDRESALQRLTLLDARLLQIEVEKCALLEDRARRDAAGESVAAAPTAPARRGFSVRY